MAVSIEGVANKIVKVYNTASHVADLDGREIPASPGFIQLTYEEYVDISSRVDIESIPDILVLFSEEPAPLGERVLYKSADGALSKNALNVVTKTTAAAMTLGAPAPGDFVSFICDTAAAHTVTCATGVFFKGLGANGTTHGVLTCDAANDGFRAVYESPTVWRVTNLYGATVPVFS